MRTKGQKTNVRVNVTIAGIAMFATLRFLFADNKKFICIITIELIINPISVPRSMYISNTYRPFFVNDSFWGSALGED